MWDNESYAAFLFHALPFNRSMMCEMDGQQLEPYPLNNGGVQQGSILGPFIF